MLGELYGGYDEGKKRLGIESDEEAEGLGFYSENGEYDELTEAWKRKIIAQRKARR